MNNAITRNSYDDRYIFHYTKTATAIEKILYYNELRFSSLSGTNDPLEFKDLTITLSADSSIPYNETDQLIDKIIKINSIRKSLKVCSFSQDYPTDSNTVYPEIYNKGFCRSRMWSQYGDSYKGICLVFQRDTLLKLIKEKYGNHVFYSSINYKNDLIDLYNSTTLQHSMIKTFEVKDLFNKYINDYLFTKLEDYRDEQEFRIAIQSAEDDILLNFQNSLNAMIISEKFPYAYFPIIESKAVELDIPLFRLFWVNGKPELKNEIEREAV